MGNFRWAFMAAIFGAVVSLLLGLVSGVGFGLVLVRALIFGAVFFGLGFALYFVVNTYFPEILYITEDTGTTTNEAGDGHISIAMDSMGEYAVPELFNKQGDPNEIGNIDDLISGIFRPGEGRSEPAESSQPAYPNVNFSMDAEGLDLNKETSYNDTSEFGDASFGDLGDISSGGFNEAPAVETPPPAEKPQVFQPQFTPQIGDDDGLGGLPDLDMMAMAFTNLSDSQPSSVSSAPASAPASAPTPSMGPMSSADESAPDRSQYKGNKAQPLQGDFQPQAIAQGIRTVLSKD